MEPKRVLHYGLTSNIGGLETFVMELYRNIDRNRIQFDFLTEYGKTIAFADEIREMGGQIYPVIVPKRESLFGHSRSWRNFFRENRGKYIAVHRHALFPNYLTPLAYAKKYGVEKRILHCNNGDNMFPPVNMLEKAWQGISEIYFRKSWPKVATDCWACSEVAARYLFGEGADYTFIPNAIDVERFQFNPRVREAKRRELYLGDSFAVGFVGRLQYQKNPEFMLDVFEQILKIHGNSILIVVGDGDRMEKIQKIVRQKGIGNKVQFLGMRIDVHELLQAFDCMVMPSRFEGLPLTAIEAQAAGLPNFWSDTVTPEAGVTDLMHYIPLEASAEEWAARICNAAIGHRRENTCAKVKAAGFDTADLARKIQEYYLD